MMFRRFHSIAMKFRIWKSKIAQAASVLNATCKFPLILTKQTRGRRILTTSLSPSPQLASWLQNLSYIANSVLSFQFHRPVSFSEALADEFCESLTLSMFSGLPGDSVRLVLFYYDLEPPTKWDTHKGCNCWILSLTLLTNTKRFDLGGVLTVYLSVSQFVYRLVWFTISLMKSFGSSVPVTCVGTFDNWFVCYFNKRSLLATGVTNTINTVLNSWRSEKFYMPYL